MGRFSSLVVLALAVGSAGAAFCSGTPDAGERVNDYPIFDAADTLSFVSSVENAQIWEAGPANARFRVLHVYGSAYDMGYAQGKILGDDIQKFMEGTYEYLLEEGLAAFGDLLPESVQAVLLTKGARAALAENAKITAEFTPQSYFDEVRGLADATGIDYDTILELNMIPEITKASCSFFGAWGDATSQSTGHTYQLRALDYITDCDAFTNYGMVVVYHPNWEGGVAHTALNWPGMVGVLTAFNEQQIGISEIGVSFADDSFGQGTPDTPPEKVRGQPWTSVLKDVAQTATDLDSALGIIEDANRTCNLIIGIGSGKDAVANGVEYSGYVAVPYNDTTLLPVNDTWHAQIDSVVYNGMDWLCPGYTSKLHDELDKYHGSIDAATTIGNILPTVQTGNLHIMVTDLTTSQIHVSFMRRTFADASEPFYAYERQFTMIDMKDMFALEAPVVVNN